MKTFAYVRAADTDTALQSITREPHAKFLAGGTNLVDLMREGIERPDTVIDITRLALDGIEELDDGRLRIGALVRNSRLAAHPLIRARYPMLAQAILHGASGQLRNMATVGGNCCMQAPAACTSTTRPRRATSVNPAPGAPRSGASTAAMRCWEPVNTVSRPTRPTWRWRSRRWTPRSR